MKVEMPLVATVILYLLAALLVSVFTALDCARPPDGQ